MSAKSKALKGYQSRDPVSHRTYNRDTSIHRFEKTGKFTHHKEGGGHKAGFSWAAKAGIDPFDKETKYSKNSSSFDEGVHLYKTRMSKSIALKKRMK